MLRVRFVRVVTAVAALTLALTAPTGPGPQPAAAATATHEAENAALSGGAIVASDHSGYTGTGFVAGYTDGNKGTAATTFTVNATSAGSATIALRYANGTTANMTLSVYVNGGKTGQLTLPPTANWDSWTTTTSTVQLAAGANAVAYRFDASDSGNVNLDNLAVTTPDQPVAGRYEAETAFFSSGPAVQSGTPGFTGTGYLSGFAATGARVSFTANLPAAGQRTATLRFRNTTGGPQTVGVRINGLLAPARLSLPPGAGWQTADHTVLLRTGLNTVAYENASGDLDIDSLAVAGGSALAARGATVPYTEYEAEDASTNGTVLGPDRTYLTVASESSGRRAVRLDQTGQYVRFTLSRPTNSIVVRYSIPDSANGAGLTAPLSLYANGQHLQDLSLSSKYAWVYGAYPYTNDPSHGAAHHFYDETRALIGDWPVGTVLELRKDSSDAAPSRNNLIRTGGYEENWRTELGALWIYADTADITSPIVISDNLISDSTYQGVLLSYGRVISGLSFDHVTIAGAGTYGIDVNNVTGSAAFSYTAVTGTGSGGLNNTGGYGIVRGPGNSGF